MNAAKELIERVKSQTHREDIHKLIAALECALEGLEEYKPRQYVLKEINSICAKGNENE